MCFASKPNTPPPTPVAPPPPAPEPIGLGEDPGRKRKLRKRLGKKRLQVASLNTGIVNDRSQGTGGLGI